LYLCICLSKKIKNNRYESYNTDIVVDGIDDKNVAAYRSVFGGIRVGNHVTIGAGAVVFQDVPDGATVVGNPVRIIKSKD